MEGTVERAGLTQVLQGFRTGRQTGVLHLDQNGATKRVYFKNGDIVFANSDVVADKLGEMLVKNGKLTRSELELAFKAQERSNLRLGKTLVEMGFVTDGELDGLVKAQVDTILSSLIPWETGSYRAEIRDNALEAGDEDIDPFLEPVELLAIPDAPVDQETPQIGPAPQGLEIVEHL